MLVPATLLLLLAKDGECYLRVDVSARSTFSAGCLLSLFSLWLSLYYVTLASADEVNLLCRAFKVEWSTKDGGRKEYR